MSDKFFIQSGASKKKKAPQKPFKKTEGTFAKGGKGVKGAKGAKGVQKGKTPAAKKARLDEEEAYDMDEDEEEEEEEDNEDDDERKRKRTRGGQGKEEEEEEGKGGHGDEDRETPAEKRVRLAKEYVNRIQKSESQAVGIDAEDLDREIIASRLKKDVLESKGRLFSKIADTVKPVDPSSYRILKGHQMPITSVAISEDELSVFSASKDCSVVKWNLEGCKKEWLIKGVRKGVKEGAKGHTDHIHDVAVSSDGKYVATAGKDKKVSIWDGKTGAHLETFPQHRDQVTGVAFRKGSHQLFSSSLDRTIKVWDVAQLAYVETLFGHQEGVTAVDSLSKERCVTAGGRDRTVRLWKIVEETQLVFRGDVESIDSLKLVNEDNFITGGDSGSVSLWSTTKKKPSVVVPHAHGAGNWISSVASLRHTDLVASGSSNGEIILWKVSENYKELTPVQKIPVEGFVNSMEFSTSGKYLVCGIGQEHRLGRWQRIATAKNSVLVIPLSMAELK